jgi:alcohol dehydrogenase class IV
MTSEQRKRTGTDERVRPVVVVYDPELTLDLSHGRQGRVAPSAA